MLEPNTILVDRYKIEREMGAGAFGKVYQAQDLNFRKDRRLVAVKEVPLAQTEDARIKNSSIMMVQREANMLAMIYHPNIVRIYDFFDYGNYAYIIMEYVNGLTVKAVLNRTKALPIAKILDWSIELTSALGATHKKDMVHGDPRADNIMINSTGNVVLIDFGIGKSYISNTDRKALVTMGSPYYLAPEQFAGHRATPTTDVYTAGITIYEMLAHELPYTGESTEEIMDKHMHAPIPDVRDINLDVDPAFAKIIMKMMSKHPDDRYPDGEAASYALSQYRDTPKQKSMPVDTTQMITPTGADFNPQRRNIDVDMDDDRRTVFISYRKLDQVNAYALADYLDNLPDIKKVWIDKELEPGKHWWNEILREIRAADLVITAISDPYLDSVACRREYEYALSLSKNILPIQIGSINYLRMPPQLATIQMPEFIVDDEDKLGIIKRAIANQPIPKPLPDPLPEPPPAPLSELNKVEYRAQKLGRFTEDDELYLASKLRRFAEHGLEDEKRTALTIITRLIDTRRRDMTGDLLMDLLSIKESLKFN